MGEKNKTIENLKLAIDSGFIYVENVYSTKCFERLKIDKDIKLYVSNHKNKDKIITENKLLKEILAKDYIQNDEEDNIIWSYLKFISREKDKENEFRKLFSISLEYFAKEILNRANINMNLTRALDSGNLKLK